MKRNQLLQIATLPLLLLLTHASFSQNQLINIHPLVGDTISHEEAYTYYMFQNYDVKIFDYAMLYEVNNGYKVFFYGEQVQEASIDSLTLNEYHENIEKIYQYMLKNDESKDNITLQDTILIESVNLKLMTPEQKDKMVKDARVYTMKMLNANEQGLMGPERDDYINKTGGYMWGKSKKK